MATLEEVISDQDFLALPEPEQDSVLRELGFQEQPAPDFETRVVEAVKAGASRLGDMLTAPGQLVRGALKGQFPARLTAEEFTGIPSEVPTLGQTLGGPTTFFGANPNLALNTGVELATDPLALVGAGIPSRVKRLFPGRGIAATQETIPVVETTANLATESGADFTGQVEKITEAFFDTTPRIQALPEQAPNAVPTTPRTQGPATVKPTFRSNLTDAATDALAKLGPNGERASILIERALDRSEQATGEAVARMRQIFEGEVGKRKRSVNPFKAPSATKLYNLSREESDVLVDFLYQGGVPQGPALEAFAALPPARQTVLRQTATRLFEEVSGPISSHPGLRDLKVLQADGSTIPVGAPSMFFPQQPVTASLNQMLSGSRFRKLFQAAKRKEPSLTEWEYRVQLMRSFDLTEQKFPGVENARIFDASFGGTVRPSKALREFGYETDPLRAYVRFAAGASRRGEFATVDDSLTALQDALRMDLATTNHPKFGDAIIDHAKGVAPRELLDTSVRGFWGGVMNANNATLLQMASLANLNQLTFAVSRGGMLNTLKAAGNAIRGLGQPNELAERSGALFINMVQEFANPSTTAGRLAMDFFRTTGFTATERNVRSFSVRVGEQYLKETVKRLKKNPKDTLARGRLRELNVNADEVVADLAQSGDISERNLLRGLQTFANRVGGREGLTGLPNFATSDKMLARVLLQYKKFALTNMVEIKRQVLNAPTAAEGARRMSRLLFGGAIIGEFVRDAQTLLTRFENPFTPDRVPKTLKGKIGPMAGRIVDDWLSATGNIMGMLAMATLQGERGLLQLAAPPALSSAIEVVTDPAKGLARRVPIVGPQIRELTRDEPTLKIPTKPGPIRFSQ